MKFENIRVMNFENAFRGMRNPKNSWHLSDSVFGLWSDKISIIPTPIVNKTLFEWKDKPAQIGKFYIEMKMNLHYMNMQQLVQKT